MRLAIDLQLTGDEILAEPEEQPGAKIIDIMDDLKASH